jgi:hypothetical protein
MDHVVTKAEFARAVGVHRTRVGQWIAAGQLSGAALVPLGRGQGIDVEVARGQLGRRLDVDQRLTRQSSGRQDVAKSGDISEALITGGPLEKLQQARLRQVELANAKAEAAAAVASGEYLLAADVRREAGKQAGTMVSAFEGMIPQFADAVAAHWDAPQPDVLHLLREVWRAARARQSALDADPAAQ